MLRRAVPLLSSAAWGSPAAVSPTPLQALTVKQPYKVVGSDAGLRSPTRKIQALRGRMSAIMEQMIGQKMAGVCSAKEKITTEVEGELTMARPAGACRSSLGTC
ncbi:hypothetical protein PI124_g8486 [Phytophthora idaei]|nr:hypothetical protein PI125_g8859 [Phytophthora idaei]KAG3151447.1 hypothetical protein PI126_g10995 [Phytophthora idaei]KAG3246815.1 hypothetical protein PI124_g8486 [Phytophthora idaei]